MRFSIILPVLNEGEHIAAALDALTAARAQGAQIIVADGGSTDNTLALARLSADIVLQAMRGRANQMNAGAQMATGEVLIFLHADTRLPTHALELIAQGLQNSALQWGRFDVAIEGHSSLLPIVARMMNLRSRLTSICTGDQALFMTREAYVRVGGFPAIALMEDIAISRALKAISPPLCVRACVTTSGRRWEKHGVLRTIALMWSLRAMYFFGVSPRWLARLYGYGDAA